MNRQETNLKEKIRYPLIFLIVIIGLIAISAEIDWFWEGGLQGTEELKELAFIFLFGVFIPVVLLFGFYIQKGSSSIKVPLPNKNDRKRFIWSIIIILILQNLIPIFYLFLNRDETIIDIILAILLLGNFVAMGTLAAYFPLHKEPSKRMKRWFLFFLIAILPFYILIASIIWITWMIPDLKLIYWILMWGVLMPLTFVFLGVSWKSRTGMARESFNIAFGGILIQYSFLEDFLYYALNGQPQPVSYNALLNLPIDLAHLFGHQGVGLSPVELGIWMGIIITIGILILFDIPYQIYQKLKGGK
ncbi:MAG: hypothetical protein ACTSRS_10305 [Candidatus Helarchaeota archaeon]